MKALRTISIATLHALATTALLHAQGPLDPPGPPAPSMKTAQQIEPRTPIESLPFTITQSGSYYLTQSLTTAGDGITIDADNVAVDLNGFAIVGTTTNPSTLQGVSTGGTSGTPRLNVTISNGSIQGFGTSVQLSFAMNCVLKDLVCATPGFTSIDLSGTQGCIISDCSIANPEDHGIRLVSGPTQSSGNHIKNCTVMGAQKNGIRVEAAATGTCSGNRVANCQVAGSGTNGISVRATDGTTTGNEISECTVTQSTQKGISLTAQSTTLCRGNAVTKCLISGSGGEGIYVFGVDFRECAGNTLTRNTIQAATDRGIFLSNSEDNRVDENHIAGTVSSGGDTAGIESTGFGNIVVKNTARGHTSDFVLSTGDSALLNNYEQMPADSRIAITSLPFTITTPGSYYLTGNLTTTDHGIKIATENVTLDLNGFSVKGDGVADSAGIRVVRENFIGGVFPVRGIAVRNGIIDNFDRGVDLRSALGALIEDLRIRDSVRDGVRGISARTCTLRRLSITDAGENGVSLDGSGNVVEHCEVLGRQGMGNGIQLDAGASGNTVRKCTVMGMRWGIVVDGEEGDICDGNLITANVVRTALLGIGISKGGGNRVQQNQVSDITGDGSIGISTIDGGGNLIVQNSVSDSDNSYDLSVDDTAGPEVSASGTLGNTGDSDHPWANFSLNETP